MLGLSDNQPEGVCAVTVTCVCVPIPSEISDRSKFAIQYTFTRHVFYQTLYTLKSVISSHICLNAGRLCGFLTWRLEDGDLKMRIRLFVLAKLTHHEHEKHDEQVLW